MAESSIGAHLTSESLWEAMKNMSFEEGDTAMACM